MLIVHFILFLGCGTVSVIGGYSPFYYSFPQPEYYSPPAFFAPIYNPLPSYHHQAVQQDVAPRMQSIGANPYHGFIYRTNLGNEATSNVFFLTGSNAHQQEQIEKFIMSARSSMDNQITVKANTERATSEKLRSVSEIIDDLFGKQPFGFQYIHNPNALPAPTTVPKGRSLSEDIPLSQRFSDESSKDASVKPTEISTTETQKEATTEKMAQTEKPETTTVVSSTTAESTTK